jgi:signal transduction histidine kinase
MRCAPRDHIPELLFAAFTAAMVGAMYASPDWQAIPFHLVWVSLTVLYGFRLWRADTTLALLGGVAVLTATPVLTAGELDERRLGELAEIPLMTAMFMVMTWHVRQRLDALQELRRAARRERDFVSDASHQLRTPITVARGHAELILAAHPGTQTADDASVVLGELERLSRISERLLVLAAAEQPGFLELEPVNLSDLVRAASTRWGALQEREWDVRETADGTLLVDRERLDAALDAVIENAINATGAGGRIVLEAAAMGQTAMLVVCDDGEGIPQSDTERVFERFARLTHSERGRRRGTGLGLPMVKAVVDAHGGSVRLDSTPGQGTRVELRLGQFVVQPARAPRLSAAAAV